MIAVHKRDTRTDCHHFSASKMPIEMPHKNNAGKNPVYGASNGNDMTIRIPIIHLRRSPDCSDSTEDSFCRNWKKSSKIEMINREIGQDFRKEIWPGVALRQQWK